MKRWDRTAQIGDTRADTLQERTLVVKKMGNVGDIKITAMDVSTQIHSRKDGYALVSLANIATPTDLFIAFDTVEQRAEAVGALEGEYGRIWKRFWNYWYPRHLQLPMSVSSEPLTMALAYWIVNAKDNPPEKQDIFRVPEAKEPVKLDKVLKAPAYTEEASDWVLPRYITVDPLFGAPEFSPLGQEEANARPRTFAPLAEW